jgi:transketolase
MFTFLDSDLPSIYGAIAEARKEKNKPTIIRLRTTIGYGSKQQGTHGVHGSRKSQARWKHLPSLNYL